MKLLILGGTGTISTAVVDKALFSGMDVTVLNRGHHQVPEGVTQLIADVRNEKEMEKALSQKTYDVVADFLTYTPEQAAQNMRLFKGRCKQFLFISSATVYQKPPRTLFMNEGVPLSNPFSPYAQNKIACENAFMDAYRNEGFPVTIVRPSYTYGDSVLPFVLNSHKSRYAIISRLKAGKPIVIPGDGNIFWTLTHHSDFAHAFVGLMGKYQAIGQAFHITSDERHTWNDFANMLADAVGVKANLVHIATDTIVKFFPDELAALTGDKAQTAVFDNTKIKAFVPDFVCKVPFEEGARRCVAYFEAHKELCAQDSEWDAKMDEMIAKVQAVGP